MTVSRPTTDLEWALSDVNDPVNGQPNVVEPGARWKTDGWNRAEVPPRQFVNWLGRMMSRWVEYLDARATDTIETRRVMIVGAGYPSLPDGTSYWAWGPDNPENGWICTDTGGRMIVPVHLRSRDRITSFGVKYYNANGAVAVNPDITLHVLNAMATVAYDATAPSSVATASLSAAATIPALSWGSRSVALSALMGLDQYAVITATGVTVGDRIAAMWVDVSTDMEA